jgi:hypothetical protein
MGERARRAVDRAYTATVKYRLRRYAARHPGVTVAELLTQRPIALQPRGVDRLYRRVLVRRRDRYVRRFVRAVRRKRRPGGREDGD